jgi:hypothetical protein
MEARIRDDGDSKLNFEPKTGCNVGAKAGKKAPFVKA